MHTRFKLYCQPVASVAYIKDQFLDKPTLHYKIFEHAGLFSTKDLHTASE